MQLIGEELLRRLPRPELRAQTPSQLQHDLHVALAVERLDRLVHRAQEVRVAPEVRHHDALVLYRHGERQHQVAQAHDGRIHEHILHDVEFQLVQRLLPAHGLHGHACERIGPEPVAHLEVSGRLVHLEPVQGHIGQRARARCIPAAVAPLLILDALRTHLIWNRVHGLIAPLAREAGRASQCDAARDIHVSRERADGQERMPRLDAIGLRVDGEAPERG